MIARLHVTLGRLAVLHLGVDVRAGKGTCFASAPKAWLENTDSWHWDKLHQSLFTSAYL